MTSLEKSLAIVTGASRGIGRAIALRLAKEGIHLVLLGRDQNNLEQVQNEIHTSGGRANVHAFDLADAAAIEQFGTEVRENYGRCDILVNCAGIGRMGKPLHESDVADFDAMIATNLRAPYLLMKTIAPLMIQQSSGHIVNISSLSGKNPLPNGAGYAASKWALHGLTYSVAEELRNYGIRVSVVAPGSVATDFSGIRSGKSPDKKLQPEDVAHVVATLIREGEHSFISEVSIRPILK